MTARSKYEPHPGTLPFRALAHMALLRKDEEISNPTLAGALGCTNSGELIKALQPALAAGKIFARQKGGHMRSPIFWSMASHSSDEHATPPEAQITIQKVQPIAATSHQVHELDIDAIHRKHDGVVDMQEERTGEHRALKDSALPVLAYRSHTLDDSDQDAAPRVRKVLARDADSSIRETIAAIRETNPLQSVWASVKFPDNPQPDASTEAAQVDGKESSEDHADQRSRTGLPTTEVWKVAERWRLSDSRLTNPDLEPEVKQDTSTDAMRFGIWDNGELHVVREGKTEVWSVQDFRQLVRFLDSISLDSVREHASD